MRIFLNSRLVSAEELSGALQVEIESRSDRIVYVQADPNLPWTEAITVIDIIRETHAKIVLITVIDKG
jgi:biopolymer transport protein ExbD